MNVCVWMRARPPVEKGTLLFIGDLFEFTFSCIISLLEVITSKSAMFNYNGKLLLSFVYLTRS